MHVRKAGSDQGDIIKTQHAQCVVILRKLLFLDPTPSCVVSSVFRGCAFAEDTRLSICQEISRWRNIEKEDQMQRAACEVAGKLQLSGRAWDFSFQPARIYQGSDSQKLRANGMGIVSGPPRLAFEKCFS